MMNEFILVFLAVTCLSMFCHTSGQNDEVCLPIQRRRDSYTLRYNSCNQNEISDLEKKLQYNRIPLCGAGFRNGLVSDSQLTASSSYNSDYAASQGRLDYQPLPNNAGGCWTPRQSLRGSSQNQWIQVNFNRPVKVFGVVTQGRSNYDEWVTSFKIQYGNSPSSLTTIPTGHQNFEGNNDRKSYKINEFNPPIVAQYFRLLVVHVHSHASLRMDYLLC